MEDKLFYETIYDKEGHSTYRIMVMGDLDSGKTTLCNGLIKYLISKQSFPIYYLDMDIGQPSFGPPCTIRLRVIDSSKRLYLRDNQDISNMIFIGSLYPYGLEEKIFLALKRILKSIPQKSNLIVDTTGYRIAEDYVINYKSKKIEIINPDLTILLRKDDNELESLSLERAIQKENLCNLLILPPQSRNRLKSKIERRYIHHKALGYWLNGGTKMAYQDDQINNYEELKFTTSECANLAGLINENGLCVGGGIVIDHSKGNIMIFGKKDRNAKVISIDIGRLKYDFINKEIVYDS